MTWSPTAKRAATILLVAVSWLPLRCSSGSDPAVADEARTRAIVLITVDGLLTEELAPFGGSHPMPALEKLLDGGTLWSDGWTVDPMTRPAVATYLTGVAPDRHGVRDDLFTALPSTIPTLASLLEARGYHTAAFPNSSFLGFGSGLLDGFEVVDEPPPIPASPARWEPLARPPESSAENIAAWLRGLPADAAYFAWLHFSETLITARRAAPRQRVKRDDDSREGGPEREDARAAAFDALDATVAAVVEALEARGQLEQAAIIVAGVSGDPRGDDLELRGPGFSLHERALRVPVLARFPAAFHPVDAAARVVWAPDVPATVAELGGVTLSDDAEGVSLLRAVDGDRILVAWSWALQDQLGWKPLRAARTRGLKRLEGFDVTTTRLDGSDDPVDPVDAERLASGLAARADPPAPALPLETVRELLAEHELELAPAPEEEREFGTAEQRAEFVKQLWGGRMLLRKNLGARAIRRYNRALELYPDNIGVLLDYGQILAGTQPEQARELLGRAVTRSPTNPEILHWYAHAIWSESLTEAERLLNAVLPYKGNDADVLYDLACARSLADDLEASEGYLRSAIRAGFRSWAHMDSDPDLRKLRESGRFAVVMREIQQ